MLWLERPHVRAEIPALIDMPVTILPVPRWAWSAAAVQIVDLIRGYFTHPGNLNVRVRPKVAPHPDAHADVSGLTIAPVRNLPANLAKKRPILLVAVHRKINRRRLADEVRLSGGNPPISDPSYIRVGCKHVSQLLEGSPVLLEALEETTFLRWLGHVRVEEESHRNKRCGQREQDIEPVSIAPLPGRRGD